MQRICRHCRWLHSYTLLVCHQHCRPAWICVAEPHHYTRLSYIPTCCVSAIFAAGYICTYYSSAVYIVDLRSLAELLWYPLLSFIHTHCLSAVYIVDLLSHVLQNLVGTHCCPSFVLAAHLPSTSSTCFHMCCRVSLVPTAVLHSHLLCICRHCHWLHPYALLVCRQRGRPVFACRASLVPTAVLHSYTLLVCHQHR